MSYNESWGNILGKYLQKRCKICPDGIGEFADIVCADAWHGDKSWYIQILKRKDGRSLIIIRTTVGVDLINQMLMSNSITTESFNINELNTIQPAQRHRRQSLFARLLAMKLMLLITPKYKGFSLFSNAMSMSFKRNIFAFCGMVLRIIRKKI
ncbi:Coenzyme F420 hydrogenase/dehydrogenase, beta subunit C-terminal domain [Escherichia coli]|uniref:Coenzyme F420 hydrogenase/dehydrogenase, beta subunit C-terminal domain n=1 Tax=Escherichia coli TaxID=562 RepID=UPI003EECECF4